MNERLLINPPSVIDLDKGKKIGNAYFVSKNQPMSAHKAVERLAYYFKREGNFDFVQYTAFEDRNNKNSDAYIWIDSDWDDEFAIGAANFRFLGDIGQSKKWSLDWVWFHPYYRNKGLLSGAWANFEKKYGADFEVTPPLTKAMERFLKKIKNQG